ncbi:MAG: hypothetical protein OWR62_03680 [Sulfobacillus thermotolerans]|nr:hypothetical protein [Sulfobacillus thermotolerans]
MYHDAQKEIARLEEEIQSLHAKLLGLRSSRRVLMNLLTLQAREKQWRIHSLELENRQLRTLLKSQRRLVKSP